MTTDGSNAFFSFSSDDRVDKLMLGLKDDMKHDEIFWPQEL
jgi:hypothetical protein